MTFTLEKLKMLMTLALYVEMSTWINQKIGKRKLKTRKNKK